MVRECRPPAREPMRSWLVRRSTMAASTPANANSPANISPVGPPPATTTACSAIRHPPYTLQSSTRSFLHELADLCLYRERRVRKSALAEGEGFEPPKACTLVVFKPQHPPLNTKDRPKRPFPQWGFPH